MYYYIDVENFGVIQRHIFANLPDGGILSFPLTDDNPNTVEYLAWVAEGNEATEWNPEETE
jgi:hypothetical protein